MSQNIYKQDIPIIVVPEGLFINNKNHIIEPSFVFRQVLDHVISNYKNNKIFLAPANDFGTGVTEQKAAFKYLKKYKVKKVIVPASYGKSYIDTLGNAKQLKQYLIKNNNWPIKPSILVVSRLHARRAKFGFESCDFKISKIDCINYTIPPNEDIVSRLWYYKYPFIHKIYEILAIIRDIIRVTLWKKRLC